MSYLERGAGPLLLCLHGFPDTPASFAYQLEDLALAGFRVVAPYMRGYPPSDTPSGSYQAAALAGDIVGLLDALGEERGVVYGHDWGSQAAYAAALGYPERVTALIASAVPYGPGLGRALLGDPEQQRRSWYMFFFQTRLAELAVPKDDFAFIDRLWRDWSPGFEPPPEVLGSVKRALAAEGGLAGALAYYRTSLDPSRRDPALAALEARVHREAIAVPTLYVHGARDGCIAPGVADGMGAWFMGRLRVEILPNVGHFTHLEAPDAFNALLRDFLG